MNHSVLILLWYAIAWTVPGRALEPVMLTQDSIKDGGLNLSVAEGWRAWPGAIENGGDPELEAEGWVHVENTYLTPSVRSRYSWPGHGWFRLEIRVEEALRGREVALIVRQVGASEIFLDGRRVLELGRVGEVPQEESSLYQRKPLRVRLGAAETQVLAVHFSGFAAKPDRGAPANKGFSIRIADASGAENRFWAEREEVKVLMAFFLGFFFVFAIYHLQMYLFYPEQRINGLVGLIGMTGAAISVVGLIQIQSQNWQIINVLNHLQQVIITATYPLLIHYTYTAFRDRTPHWVWGWYALIPLDIVLRYLQLPSIANVIQVIALLEVIRQTVWAIYHGKPGSRILGIGILIVVTSVLLEVLGLSSSIRGLLNQRVGLPFLGALVLFLLISFQVSKKVADTNRQLSLELKRVQTLSAQMLAQEREARELEVARRVLEADHARKTQELEAARQLQLSMLPKKLPGHRHFEIAAFMATATEVGGDYYDVHVGENGVLTIAVGDATGHGSKAGTMVAAVKGLFALLAGKQRLPDIFLDMNEALRTMKLRGMFMAMTLLRIEGHQIRTAIAGMPPLFIWRAASRTVEILRVKALPLGGVGRFPYSEETLEMGPGDVLVVMSDGLPEMFDTANAMLGEDRIEARIAASEDRSAQGLIDALCQLGTQWRGSREQDDDLTLMVLKAKE